jgi:hypothetical protein
MRFLIIFLAFIAINQFAFSESKIDTALQHKILSMFKEDQKWRIESNNLYRSKKSAYSEDAINSNMGKTDSLNLIEAKLIVVKYGFPGYDLVGENGSDDFWAIVQHCDQDIAFQQMALVLMDKQVKRHNASNEKYALLEDRILISEGHKQIYGTQVRLDLKTHLAKPLPIEDSLHVDSRRKAVGLSPLDEYLKIFNNR